jgi:orotate phosphoribosyltransferase
MTSSEALSVFKESGALLEGHLVLRSGLHSRQYFQCALALQQMPVVERLGKTLADQIRQFVPQTIVSPAMGGLVIGQEVGRQLGVRFIFTEKEDGKLALRRGFQIAPGEKIVVVEDVITKGGRVRETIEIVHGRGGRVLAVAMIVDRSDGTLDLGVPLFSLIRMKVESFTPDRLPPDLAALPVIKPGSK